MDKTKFRIRSCALSAVLLFANAVSGADDPALSAFLSLYRCTIVERLEKIHKVDFAQEMNRYLILDRRDQDHSFVQCIFYERDTKMRCEASSGFYSPPPGHPKHFKLTADGVAKLARHGFSTDATQGNYIRELAIRSPKDITAAADFLLTVFHEVYGARVDIPIKITAPLVNSDDLAFSHCKPSS